MKNLRRQSVPGCKRIQIGGVDLAIEPGLQPKTSLFEILKRAVTDAQDDMAGVRQFAGRYVS